MAVLRERHPEYYFDDGMAHFLISEPTRQTLYRLYPGLLTLRSSVLKSLFSLPQPGGQQSAREGTCDENPIVLHGIIRREFDYLLAFLSGGYAGEQHREEFLICTQPAFRDLLSRPLSSISRAEACRMGLEYFYILAHTKSLVEGSCRSIAYTAPPHVQPPICTTPSRCEASWKEEWWNGIARQLLHPYDPSCGHEILAWLDDAEIPGLCAACKEATISELKDKQMDVLFQEEEVVNTAVMEIMALQTDEPIRASFRQLHSH
ncbi:hypothetical protein L210DRAFT_3549710 [Boletus edulis BED1]|uniref:BTB domain-containing protein n=1 Tax=Boletus edulis BED1 TaxID=1328754 RepID=A0AAD4GCA3_BOLED|nr:hypothetical protein L210DRAFT_3549710 [Boletus edulis BED1]